TTLLNFLEAFPARYVSEDVFFLADRRMRSFPNPIKKARFGFTTLFYTLFHILPYHLTRFEDPMQRFSGRFSTACRAPEDVFFLERSPDRGIFGLPTIEGLHKLGSLNNRVFLYFYERVLAAAAFIYPEMALVDLQRHQAAIFKEQLDGARYHVIRADHPREFIQLLQTHYRAVKGATAGAPQP
ncbi:MAG: hypothetical protein GY697_14155, partial [Desulfobacterales bacterium]|nr:hypothetical protein [Desulfobacterales bacterium]